MGASAQKIPAWQRVDFIGRTKYWFAVSGAVLSDRDLRRSRSGCRTSQIDFKGGSQFSFKMPEAPPDPGRPRADDESSESGAAVIQGRGQVVERGPYKEFQVLNAVRSGCRSRLTPRPPPASNLNATSVGVKNAGRASASRS